MEKDQEKNLKKVREFDKELRKLYDYDFLMARYLGWFLCVMGAMCTMCTMPEVGSDKLDATSLVPFVIDSMAITVYFRPYLSVNESGSFVPIYEKLRYMPVTRRDIALVRMKYLNEFCVRMLLLHLVAGQFAMLFETKWHLLSIVYPFLLSALLWLGGMVTICASRKRI